MSENIENIEPMNTKNVTIKELAAHLGVDYITATGFIKVLEIFGAAKENGNRPNPEGTRGKPSKVYGICADVIELVLFPEPEPKSENVPENVVVESVESSPVMES